MFKKFIVKSIAPIGIRRFSNNNNNNNKIVEEIKEVNRTLNFIYVNTLILNLVTCITFLKFDE